MYLSGSLLNECRWPGKPVPPEAGISRPLGKPRKRLGEISPVLVAAAKNIRIAAASGRGNMEGLDFAKQRLNEMLDVLNKAGESL